jgi:hypothetical protein
MKPRPFLISLILMIVTVVLGIAIRFVPLGLPMDLVKYGGSAMWAMMIYWVFTLIRPTWYLIPAFFASGLVATGLEFFKLYHAYDLDVFRSTLLGELLLGRFFSGKDIVAYWLAILVAVFVDSGFRKAEYKPF